MIHEKANEKNINLTPSFQNNLLRKITLQFPDLRFVERTGKSVLVYPSSLNLNDLLVKYYNLKLESDYIKHLKTNDEKKVIQVTKLLHETIQSQS